MRKKPIVYNGIIDYSIEEIRELPDERLIEFLDSYSDEISRKMGGLIICVLFERMKNIYKEFYGDSGKARRSPWAKTGEVQ